MKNLNSFAKRAKFSSLIFNRNSNITSIYKTDLSLKYKKEIKNPSNQVNYNVDNNFNNSIKNISIVNDFINKNEINLFLSKRLIFQKDFLNRYLSNFNIYNKKNFFDVPNQTLNYYIKNINSLSSQTKTKSPNENISTTISKIVNTEKNKFIFKNESNDFVFKNKQESEKNKTKIENRVIKLIEEKIEERINTKNKSEISILNIKTNHIEKEREEIVLTNKIYESVIKKLDKEKKRRGYLYE